MRGRAAKFALDAEVLTAFVEAHTEHRKDGTPLRERRYINNIFVEDPTDSRVLRRWKSSATGDVTLSSAVRLLANYNLVPADLYAWADERGYQAIKRGGHRNGR